MRPKRIIPGKSVRVEHRPDCDICVQSGYSPPRKARYDFRTRQGQWANGCTEHYRLHRASDILGVGRGQMLLEPSEIA